MSHILYLGLLVIIGSGNGWRAVPANQAMYGLHSKHVGLRGGTPMGVDELLPRDRLHSVYKYGFCARHVVTHQYLHRSFNVTLPTWQDSQAQYIYVLANKHTQRFGLQCVVMRTYVPRKYLFRKSKIPIYYCQGHLFIMMFSTVQKLEIHEFYLRSNLNLPVNFVFEFYHPPME